LVGCRCRDRGVSALLSILFAVETENGVLLTPYDPVLEQGMKAYNRIAKKHRGALKELAR
jgi:hypothetical protein